MPGWFERSRLAAAVVLGPAILAATATAADARHRSVKSADGVEIHYRIHGDGGPAIVFVHGWACDSRFWDRQLDHFARLHTVVTVDLAGHGDSGQDRREWTIGRFADDVAAVISQLERDQVVLVGHSMGGAVAVEAARRFDRGIIGIVGADTFHRVGRARLTPAEIDRRAAPFRANFAATVRSFAGSSYCGARADPRLRSQVVERMASMPAAPAVAALLAFEALDHEAGLAALRVPLVAINSDRLAIDVARIRSLVPHFELRTMSGAGHFVMLEDPEQFNRLLEDAVAGFLARADGSQAGIVPRPSGKPLPPSSSSQRAAWPRSSPALRTREAIRHVVRHAHQS